MPFGLGGLGQDEVNRRRPLRQEAVVEQPADLQRQDPALAGLQRLVGDRGRLAGWSSQREVDATLAAALDRLHEQLVGDDPLAQVAERVLVADELLPQGAGLAEEAPACRPPLGPEVHGGIDRQRDAALGERRELMRGGVERVGRGPHLAHQVGGGVGHLRVAVQPVLQLRDRRFRRGGRKHAAAIEEADDRGLDPQAVVAHRVGHDERLLGGQLGRFVDREVVGDPCEDRVREEAALAARAHRQRDAGRHVQRLEPDEVDGPAVGLADDQARTPLQRDAGRGVQRPGDLVDVADDDVAVVLLERAAEVPERDGLEGATREVGLLLGGEQLSGVLAARHHMQRQRQMRSPRPPRAAQGDHAERRPGPSAVAEAESIEPRGSGRRRQGDEDRQRGARAPCPRPHGFLLQQRAKLLVGDGPGTRPRGRDAQTQTACALRDPAHDDPRRCSDLDRHGARLTDAQSAQTHSSRWKPGRRRAASVAQRVRAPRISRV
ncbi:MAG TPA: hypothetical protein VK501_01540 [Baekduia sp.]|uniref:hypothetical protein n=1 Tax=Baekduia sp. TaxID=2600305 RepID=UPI002B72C16B|nr:hypothetical protein [Baekduia sp.]HMJ32571.1 hypothetical protein [Baekduia sp.]